VFDASKVVPVPTLGAGQTDPPTPSRSPTATPVPVVVDETLDLSSITVGDEGVSLGGSGNLVGNDIVTVDSPLYIAPQADLVLEVELVVTKSLDLGDNSSLAAVGDAKIVLNAQTELRFEATTEVARLPKLDLGLIGEDYDVVPEVFNVDVSEIDFGVANLAGLEHPLVRGRTLANCEKWQEAIKFVGSENKLATVCKYDESGGAKALANERTRTLYVVQAGGPGGGGGGVSLGVIIGIVVAVVVVAVIIVVVVIVTKKGNDAYQEEKSVSA
jgi:hypothetical protein